MQDNIQVTITSAISIMLFSAIIAGILSLVMRKDKLLSTIKYEILLICMAIPLVKILIPVEMLPLTYNINVPVILPTIVQFFNLKIVSIGTTKITVWSVVLVLLIIGYVMNTAKVILAYVNSRRMVKMLQKVDEPLLYEVTNRLLAEKKKEITIDLKWLDPEYSPMTGGILKPYILLPKRELTEEEWESVLRHELAHYLNGDSVIRFIWVLVKTLCWWNPIVKILNEQFEQLMEIRADQNAIKNLDGKAEAAYMDTLVALSTEEPEEEEVDFCTLYQSNSISAQRRVRIMLAREKKKTVRYWAVNLVMVLLGIVFAVAMNVLILEPREKTPEVENYQGSTMVSADNCFLIKNEDGTYDMYFDGVYCLTVEDDMGSNMPIYKSLEEALGYEENR